MVIEGKELENPYMTDESKAFFEGYCFGKSITTQILAFDIEQYNIVCNLYDKYLKDK